MSEVASAHLWPRWAMPECRRFPPFSKGGPGGILYLITILPIRTYFCHQL